MDPDEQAIRDVIDTWARATAAGDILTLMTLMASDVVFLAPGKPPMRRDEFAAAFTDMIGRVRVDSVSDIQELHLCGDFAYCWNHLDVTVTPLKSESPIRRSGYALTLYRKENGVWVIARDANLLA